MLWRPLSCVMASTPVSGGCTDLSVAAPRSAPRTAAFIAREPIGVLVGAVHRVRLQDVLVRQQRDEREAVHSPAQPGVAEHALRS
jgi:hypothetical protein